VPTKPELAGPTTRLPKSPPVPSLTSTGPGQMPTKPEPAGPTARLLKSPPAPSLTSTSPGQVPTKLELAARTAPKPSPIVNPILQSKLQLKGISAFKNRRVATINGRSLFKGEDMDLNVDGAMVKVRCLEIKSSSAVFEVEGMTEKLELKLAY
jgi:hypothetical protein